MFDAAIRRCGTNERWCTKKLHTVGTADCSTEHNGAQVFQFWSRIHSHSFPIRGQKKAQNMTSIILYFPIHKLNANLIIKSLHRHLIYLTKRFAVFNFIPLFIKRNSSLDKELLKLWKCCVNV